MQTLKINFFDNVDEIIRKAKRKFGEDKGFGFALWPDGSLRLIIKGGNYEETQKRT